MNSAACSYPGRELYTFAQARNWKRYWAGQIATYVGPSVLEVGAGIGSNTVLLARHATTWLCLEPDPVLAGQIGHCIEDIGSVDCRVVVGTLDDVARNDRFDTILYLDVLEHILDDRAELENAASRLAKGGYLVVLCPAYQWLFSPMDAAVGHHRRYSRKGLVRLSPPGLVLRGARYLDSVGILASFSNRWILRAPTPSRAQILVWDRMMVPLSFRLDRLVRFGFGKTVLAVWQKP